MDQESKDANMLLVELERGLQSQNVGEQSEAVVRFTSLFQRYPLPLLINSGCLKLAEAFRCSCNFIRIQICEVYERNQSHIGKIYSIEEVYRNLFTVTASNDPYARSITLMTLGNIASILKNHRSIHHCIRSSLDSQIECELVAAIYSAACFVRQSAEFACNIYPKIVSIIDSHKTSIDTKTKALSVLDHGFYNAHDAMEVRLFLIKVTESCKVRKFVCAALTLSTRISFTSLSHITPQINLLLGIFHDEFNKRQAIVKMIALRNLEFLADNCGHIWESSQVEPLILNLENKLIETEQTIEQDDTTICIILSIFCKLTTCKCNFIAFQQKSRIFKICHKLAANKENLKLRALAFKLFVVIFEDYNTEFHNLDISHETYSAIEIFINDLNSIVISDEKSHDQLVNDLAYKSIYRHIARLGQLSPSYCPTLLKLACSKISHKDTPISRLSPYLTELICAMSCYSIENSFTADQVWKLIKTKHKDMSDKNLLNLCNFYFQIVKLSPKQDVVDGFEGKVVADRDTWFSFRLMRQALRYGHHKTAGFICHNLRKSSTNDTTDSYFKSLSRISEAETILTCQEDQDLDVQLKVALPLYEEAVSPLRVSVGYSNCSAFQVEFLWLRIKTLQAHNTFRLCCRVHENSPITFSALLNSISGSRVASDMANLKSATTQQMSKIAKDFRGLAECYEGLAQVSFNCDDETLDYIHLIKCSCLIMADAIDAIFQYGKNLSMISAASLSVNSKTIQLEHRPLMDICKKLIESIKKNVIETGIQPSSESIEPLIVFLKSFSTDLLRCHFVYPRFFFQALQNTRIKLALSPVPVSVNSTHFCVINTNFVLKVEGLIENSYKRSTLIRKVSKVILTLNKTPTAKGSVHSNLCMQMSAQLEPQNNYFKTDFLIPLKWSGNFNIDITVSIMDDNEQVWKTGPTERVPISVT